MNTDEYVEPLSVKVTKIKNRYHCRLFDHGKLYDEMACSDKRDIGYCCRYMMRWYDKMGGVSRWASRARERHYKDLRTGRIWHSAKISDEQSLDNRMIVNSVAHL